MGSAKRADRWRRRSQSVARPSLPHSLEVANPGYDGRIIAMTPEISRRNLLASVGAALALPLPARSADDKPGQRKLKVAIFSKHLQFVAGEELAKAAASVGFDGIDITVRKGGHVAPERVRQDLPPLVAIIRRHGLEVPMITADIIDTQTPFTEDILKTMQELGIR